MPSCFFPLSLIIWNSYWFSAKTPNMLLFKTWYIYLQLFLLISDVWNKGWRLFKFIQPILFLFCEIIFLWQSNFQVVSCFPCDQPTTIKRLNASQTTTQAPPRGAWEGWTKSIALPVTKTLEITALTDPLRPAFLTGKTRQAVESLHQVTLQTVQMCFLCIGDSWNILLWKSLTLVY